MAPKRRMPEFASDGDEAKWLHEHRHELDDYLEPMTDRQVAETQTELAKLKRSESISLRLPASDLVRAKALAEQKGLGYQTYLKALIRDGLDRDEQLHLREVAVLLASDIDRLKGTVSKSPGFDADLFQHLQQLATLVDKLGIGNGQRRSA